MHEVGLRFCLSRSLDYTRLSSAVRFQSRLTSIELPDGRVLIGLLDDTIAENPPTINASTLVLATAPFEAAATKVSGRTHIGRLKLTN